MARKRSACYLSIALITFMSGSRTFFNFGAKTPPDRRPVRQARSAALHNGLRALGWEKGHNVRIEWRWASGDEAARFSDYAAELVKLSPDFSSRRKPGALRGESPLIPSVFVIVSDPVAPGFIPGVRAGGQITGQDVARRLISRREPPGR
jgi:hypothetical protein